MHGIVNKLLGGLNITLGGAGVATFVTYLIASPNETLCITYDVAGYALMLVALIGEYQRRTESPQTPTDYFRR